jgi:hypothetical protein
MKIDKPFSVPEISIWMDESQYIKAIDLLGDASILTGGPESNPEYDRGMAELIMLHMGWSGEHIEEIVTAIHNMANEPK